MKVFISWSGNRSKAVADVVRKWLPSVLQAVRPYYSPDDIAKGARWSSEIAKELEVSRIGLLILTPENQDAPWLLFEAGALAKNLDRSKVCPLLFGGLEATDVKGPLVQFQSARFDADEMKRVVKMMNSELGDGALTADVLEGVFEMWFPRLEDQVKKALAEHEGEDSETRRTDRELIEEVLELSRSLARDRERSHDFDHPAYEELFYHLSDLVRLAAARSADEELVTAMRRLRGPLEYFALKGPGRRYRSRALRHLMVATEELLARERKLTSPNSASDASEGAA